MLMRLDFLSEAGVSARSDSFSNGEYMQELTIDQTEEVAGGLAPVAAGALAGAALGGYSAWHGGGNAGQVVAGALLGGVSRFYGGLGMWGSSIASGVFSSFVGGGGGRWTLAPVAAK